MKNLSYDDCIKNRHFHSIDLNITFDNDNGIYEDLELIVFYDYEPESFTDHPYGESYAREYHGAEINIYAVFSLNEFKQYNENDEVIKIFSPKQNMFEIDGFSDYYVNLIEEKIAENISQEDDYFEDDRDFY